jgi:hypothetical protein
MTRQERAAQHAEECSILVTDTMFSLEQLRVDIDNGQDNGFEGADWHMTSGRTVRVDPIDGEWDVGIDVYVFGPAPGQVLESSARLQGFTPAVLAHLVAEIAKGA